MEVEIEVRQPELKPCPFCGQSQTPEKVLLTDESGEQHAAERAGKVLLRAKQSDVFGYGQKVEPFMMFWVSCGKCGAKGGIGIEHKNSITGKTVSAEQAERIAIDKWNNRSL